MNTKRSKLELFTLRNSVSELSETEKETALKIVGGAPCNCSYDEGTGSYYGCEPCDDPCDNPAGSDEPQDPDNCDDWYDSDWAEDYDYCNDDDES